MAAIPAGLTLAGALVLSGLGDEPGPADGTSSAAGADAGGGGIGDAVSDDSNLPVTATEDDFFVSPTAAPGTAEPRDDSGPRTSTVTASSSAEGAGADDADEGARGGGSSSGGGNGNGGGGNGGGGGGGGQAAGGPQASAVVTLVNDERSSNGCGPVRVDDRLTAAAQEHSQDMNDRDYMAHESPEGEGPGDRARRHGYDAWGAENVAKGQQSAAQVMDAWMNSSGHRANILNCDLKAIGVGEAGNAWTQKFGYE